MFFIIWGIIWLALDYENNFNKLLSGFFIAFGLFMFIKYYYKLKRDDKEILADERSELNMLINEILFVAFLSPVFAIALVSYTLAYYRYDRGG